MSKDWLSELDRREQDLRRTGAAIDTDCVDFTRLINAHARELIDAAKECDNLRTKLAEVERERDELQIDFDEVERWRDELLAGAKQLKADNQKLRELLRRVEPVFKYATCDECKCWPGESDGSCKVCTERLNVFCEIASALDGKGGGG